MPPIRTSEPPAADQPVLRLRGLRTQFQLEDGVVDAVEEVDLEIGRGETLAVVGESGCGKSVMARSVLGLVDRPGKIMAGQVWVPAPPEPVGGGNGAGFLARRARARRAEVLPDAPAPPGMIDLATADPAVARGVRGKRIAMVFQEPMTSLSMMHTIGNQIIEAIRLHDALTKQQARQRAIDLLGRVGIPAPEDRIDAYPFQLSGGMRQRAMIAMALSCGPELLIADEPTTALDVTTQAQILELLTSLQTEFEMSIMLITHDLGVAAQTGRPGGRDVSRAGGRGGQSVPVVRRAEASVHPSPVAVGAEARPGPQRPAGAGPRDRAAPVPPAARAARSMIVATASSRVAATPRRRQ